MADTASYLLRWDLERFRSQLSDASESFTKFGSSLRSIIGGTSTDLSNLQQKAASVTQTLSTLSPQLEGSIKFVHEGTQSMSRLMDSIAQGSSKVAAEVSRAAASASGGGAGGGSKMQRAQSQVTILLEGAAFANASVEVAQTNVGEVIRVIADADKRSAQDMDRVSKYLQAELASAGSKVKEVVSNAAPGGILSGGILAGLLSAMVLGVTEADRKHKEAGEFLNVIEATGEALTSKQSRNAYDWFRKFQERAQWYYGVSREETQSVVKVMVDAGYKARDIMDSFDSDLGKAGRNVAMASLALDKHLNQDSSTSINNIVQIASNLGEPLQEAADKYVKLAIAGQRSAMGVSKFTDAVISGASAMQQYGIDVQDVAGIMMTVQKHYQDMGLDPRYAGNQAAQVVGGISQSIANMNPSMRAVIGKKMFPEMDAQDAAQKMMDGFRRVASGENDVFLTRAIITMRNWAAEGGRSRSQAIRILESQGMDNRTAATLVDIGEKLATGNQLTDLTKEEHERLKNAFLTEGEKVSELAKTQRDFTNIIANIGQGILKLLAGLLGVIVLAVRSIPMAIESLLPWSTVQQEDLDRVARQYDKLYALIGKGVSEIKQGVMDAAEEGEKKLKGSQFSPLVDALRMQIDTRGGATMGVGPENLSALGTQLEEMYMPSERAASGVSPMEAYEYQERINEIKTQIAFKKRGEQLMAPGIVGAVGIPDLSNYETLEQLEKKLEDTMIEYERRYEKDPNKLTPTEKKRLKRQKEKEAREKAGSRQVTGGSDVDYESGDEDRDVDPDVGSDAPKVTVDGKAVAGGQMNLSESQSKKP